MKLVEGQLQVLKFISQFSGVSHSIASDGVREFVRVVEQSNALVPDIISRWIQPVPSVDENGMVSDDWAHPTDEAGRIFSGKG